MPVPLPEYIKIKDNYCIAYYGSNKEYLIQLKLLRPIMEKTFPGIKVYLSCQDNATYLLNGEERIITHSELKENKHLFAYIRELTCNMLSHPIEDFMNESDIPFEISKIKSNLDRKKCVLFTNGIIPVRSLTGDQIKAAIDYIKKNGCDPEINTSIDNSDWVVGVECEQLYEAAAKNKHVTLIPTRVGENLFKKMFPLGEILVL